ncbi:hypothetical protein ACFFJ7_18520 [Pseudochelatococcus lubricantis]|uniref:hypothetical protein n=1 Tax=Pseudochelatococcus lubricantis TaxID=1538102 RepID=UPI0035EE7100
MRRLTLWRAALERWDAWNFAATSERKMLSTVSRSALGYGVVGWLSSELQMSLSDLEQCFQKELRALDMRWHTSLGSAISDFYRLISRHQVLAHAAGCSTSDEDWLPGPNVHLPAAATDVYLQRRFHWSEGQLSA